MFRDVDALKVVHVELAIKHQELITGNVLQHFALFIKCFTTSAKSQFYVSQISDAFGKVSPFEANHGSKMLPEDTPPYSLVKVHRQKGEFYSIPVPFSSAGDAWLIIPPPPLSILLCSFPP